MKTLSPTDLPPVIAFATRKGGTGKTTLVRSLGAYWLKHGLQPALIDADPQQDLSSRHDPEGPLKGLSIIVESSDARLPKAIAALQEDERRPIIIDTPGSDNRTALVSMLYADLVVIPVKPSAGDIDGAVFTMQRIKEINETEDRQELKEAPIDVLWLLSMTRSQETRIAIHVRNQLLEAGFPVMRHELHNRNVYFELSMDGGTPIINEPKGRAAADIWGIGSEIAEAYALKRKPERQRKRA